MGRCWFSLGLMLVAGCSRYKVLEADKSDSGTGGAPATITGNGGDLLDDVDNVPPCCVSAATSPFQGPSWFAIGEPGLPADCPGSTVPGLTGYADMKTLEPHTCPACSCSPAACTLPEGVHTNAAKCPGDGSIAVPFGPDPAAGWEGVCSDDGALPANLQCGGVPCAQSVSVPAMLVAPCKPASGPAEPFPDPTWGSVALECKFEPLPGQSCAAGDVCAPKPPEGFSLCLYAKGDHPTCPAEYPARMVFFLSVKDDRACGLCECSASQGADCMAMFQVFSDAACGTFAGGVVVTDLDASCFDVVPGTALGSAEAAMLVDTPGSCAPVGGAPFGTVIPADPLTLCCQGEPEPPG